MSEENILKTVAARIKNLRGDMTQKEFALSLGVSPQAVSAWENADKMPRVGVLEKLSEIYGVSKSYILGGNIDIKNEAPEKPRSEKLSPIFDNIDRNTEEFEKLTPEEIEEVVRQMEFTIQYVKNKRNSKNS